MFKDVYMPWAYIPDLKLTQKMPAILDTISFSYLFYFNRCLHLKAFASFTICVIGHVFDGL